MFGPQNVKLATPLPFSDIEVVVVPKDSVLVAQVVSNALLFAETKNGYAGSLAHRYRYVGVAVEFVVILIDCAPDVEGAVTFTVKLKVNMPFAFPVYVRFTHCPFLTIEVAAPVLFVISCSLTPPMANPAENEMLV